MLDSIIKRSWCVVLAVGLAQTAEIECRADFVLSVDSSMIRAGETTVLDVYVSNESSSGTGTALPVSFTEFSFAIAGGDGTSELRFQAFDDLPADPPFDYVTDDDYLFLVGGGMPEYEDGISTPQLYFGIDTRVAAGNTIIPFGETRLLTQVEVTHVLGAGQDPATFATTTFTVEPGAGAGFEDASFNDVATAPDLFRTGTITVTAVPEPSTMLAMGLGSTVIMLRRRKGSPQKAGRRGRKHRLT